TSGTQTFTYYAAPTISSIVPSTGPQSGSQSVTITGTNLSASPAVTFDGTAATNVVASGSTSLTATTPVHGAGTVPVVVTTQGGSASTTFVYQGLLAPLTASVSPNTASLSSSATISFMPTTAVPASGQVQLVFGSAFGLASPTVDLG